MLSTCIHGTGPCQTCWDKLEIAFWQRKAILMHHRLEMIAEGCYTDIEDVKKGAASTLAHIGDLPTLSIY